MAKQTDNYPREIRLKQYENGLYITMRPHKDKDIVKSLQHGDEIMIHFGRDKKQCKVILGVEIIAFPLEDLEAGA